MEKFQTNEQKMMQYKLTNGAKYVQYVTRVMAGEDCHRDSVKKNDTYYARKFSEVNRRMPSCEGETPQFGVTSIGSLVSDGLRGGLARRKPRSNRPGQKLQRCRKGEVDKQSTELFLRRGNARRLWNKAHLFRGHERVGGWGCWGWLDASPNIITERVRTERLKKFLCKFLKRVQFVERIRRPWNLPFTEGKLLNTEQCTTLRRRLIPFTGHW